MNAIQQLLTDHIDIWTDADTEKKSGRGRSSSNAASVYGIRKLRELILELAVRGKLVPQDPHDELASVLLKRIQAEKAKLIAEGKIKKDKPLAPITDEEKPFELPHGWEWVRIGRIGHDWGQKTPDFDFTYIEVSAIDSQRGIVSSPELVKPENAPSRARKVVKKGSVIYSTVRPYLLNIAVIEDDFLPEPIASTAFAIVHPYCLMPPRYFLCFFRSPVFVRYVESVQTGIAYPAINDGQFFSGLIALPPIEEQHRIVAKVDELMALCDQLETRHNNAAEAHKKLMSHLLGTLTQSQKTASPLSKRGDGGDLGWQRITAHFDTLFTTEASIDALKQTLLQLAVMGKLVPQDPNDEPASELLKRIQTEKARLIAEGKIKKDKPLPPITDDEKPFDLPQGWEFSRFWSLALSIKSGGTPSKHKSAYWDGDIPWASVKDLKFGEPLFSTQDKISEAGLLAGSTLAEAGSILICTRMGLGKIGEAKIDVAINQDLKAVILSSLMDKQYFINFYKTLSIAGSGMTVAGIKQDELLGFVVPLPPLAEQHRIVAKVDELMALCDHLKTRLSEANQLQQKLADVVVEQAIA